LKMYCVFSLMGFDKVKGVYLLGMWRMGLWIWSENPQFS